MLEKIICFLKDHLSNNDLSITEQTTFAELGFDSLDLLLLVFVFEKKFNITLDMDKPIDTIGKLVKVLETAMN